MIANSLKIGYRLESWHHAFAQYGMVAVRTLLTSDQSTTKEERAEMAKEFLGTNAANRPFYWKHRADGKKLVRSGYSMGTSADMFSSFSNPMLLHTRSHHISGT